MTTSRVATSVGAIECGVATRPLCARARPCAETPTEGRSVAAHEPRRAPQHGTKPLKPLQRCCAPQHPGEPLAPKRANQSVCSTRDSENAERHPGLRPAVSTCSVYWAARWQFPEFRHACTSEQVVGCPSSVHPQPNCEHHHCWLLDIDLYVSELLVTRVPVVAHAESRVHAMIERNVAFAIFFMIVTFRGKCRRSGRSARSGRGVRLGKCAVVTAAKRASSHEMGGGSPRSETSGAKRRSDELRRSDERNIGVEAGEFRHAQPEPLSIRRRHNLRSGPRHGNRRVRCVHPRGSVTLDDLPMPAGGRRHGLSGLPMQRGRRRRRSPGRSQPGRDRAAHACTGGVRAPGGGTQGRRDGASPRGTDAAAARAGGLAWCATRTRRRLLPCVRFWRLCGRQAIDPHAAS